MFDTRKTHSWLSVVEEGRTPVTFCDLSDSFINFLYNSSLLSTPLHFRRWTSVAAYGAGSVRTTLHSRKVIKPDCRQLVISYVLKCLVEHFEHFQIHPDYTLPYTEAQYRLITYSNSANTHSGIKLIEYDKFGIIRITARGPVNKCTRSRFR